MPCAKNQPLSDELQNQLSLLENSQSLIRSILLGISLQYKALDVQKFQLLESARNPNDTNITSCQDPKSIQIAASLIVLCALVGFQKQAEEIACQTAQAGGCPDYTESKLNATVILVALIRLARLVSPEKTLEQGETKTSSQDQEVEELEQLETFSEPAI